MIPAGRFSVFDIMSIDADRFRREHVSWSSIAYRGR
jgi:hypothetical protein